jgi:6-pyruvoyltetrahydropterin/6-carboxytetrahydropterin synthase
MGPYFIVKAIEFCYGHRLQGHAGPCRHLHGHNARVELTVASATLNAQGLAIDFREVKEIVQGWVDAHLDHQMLLHCEDPLVATLQAADEPVYLMDHPPSAENIARLIYDESRKAGLATVEIRLWENSRSCAIYRPDA